MKVIADTNVLVRAAIRDDEQQAAVAVSTLTSAEVVAVPIPALCEFAWVLRHRYKLPAAKVAVAVRALVNAQNVKMDRQAAAAGLEMLDVGGDFADGVIAWQGVELGGEAFVSFDKQAVRQLAKLGVNACPPT